MDKNILSEIGKEFRKQADYRQARNLSRFFKTGPGEYGEGDLFLGIKVPVIRYLVAKYKDIPLETADKFVKSKYHEERLFGLLVLVDKFKKAGEEGKKIIFDYYLANTEFVNNWDLVDLTCHKIVGPYLWGKDRSILYKLVKSQSLWERRISIISTFYFISRGECRDSLKLAKILLPDKHDLIHKAVGWTLREVGKKCGEEILEKFLRENYKDMPRTTLRYAIEKFDEKKRKYYLTL